MRLLGSAGVAVLVANRNNTGMIEPFANRSKIPVCMLDTRDAKTIKGELSGGGDGVQFAMFRPETPTFGYAEAALLIAIATSCVVAGSMWASYDERTAVLRPYAPLVCQTEKRRPSYCTKSNVLRR